LKVRKGEGKIVLARENSINLKTGGTRRKGGEKNPRGVEERKNQSLLFRGRDIRNEKTRTKRSKPVEGGKKASTGAIILHHPI